MISDTLYRIVNIAGGLDLDADLWRRQVLGAPPARVRTGAIRRRIDAALQRDAAVTRRTGKTAVVGEFYGTTG